MPSWELSLWNIIHLFQVLARYLNSVWHKANYQKKKKKVYKIFSECLRKIWDNLLRFPLTVSGKDHMIKKFESYYYFLPYYILSGLFLTYNWGWIITISYFKYKNMERTVWLEQVAVLSFGRHHCSEKQNEYFLLGNSMVYIYYCCNI